MQYKNFGKNPTKSTLDLGRKRKTKADDFDDDEDFERTNYRGGLFYKRSNAVNFTYYLDSSIAAPSNYQSLLHCLNELQECDSLAIFLNSGGGRLDTAMAIVAGINNTEGNVTVISNGMAASAAGIILLQSPNIVITPISQMMCHSASFGVIGKTGEIESNVSFSKKYIDKLLDDTYSGFMTEEEIKDLKKGVDYYFDSEEIIERLGKRNEYQDKLDEKKAIEEAKASKPQPKTKPKVKAKVKTSK
jgi:ATP-dependent protease ClpP protease subunit